MQDGRSDLQPSSQPTFCATSSLFLDHQVLIFAPGRETPDRLFYSASCQIVLPCSWRSQTCWGLSVDGVLPRAPARGSRFFWYGVSLECFQRTFLFPAPEKLTDQNHFRFFILRPQNHLVVGEVKHAENLSCVGFSSYAPRLPFSLYCSLS